MKGNTEQGFVRIELDVQQKEQVKHATGREADALEFTIEQLEERIAPRLSANHNETLLA